MLVKKGRIEIEITPAHFMNLHLQARNISVKSISTEIAELSVNFNNEINNDPADRLIGVTSIIHNARLVIADTNLKFCDLINILWRIIGIALTNTTVSGGWCGVAFA